MKPLCRPGTGLNPEAHQEPKCSGVALLIVDMINEMSFEGAENLQNAAAEAVPRILTLRDQADALGAPVIYINDNYDQWHSDRSRIIAHCMKEGSPGRNIAQRMAPRENDYFVIKPSFSGFYATILPVLLPRHNVGRLVLTGVAADICVLFTAADAHMRGYDVWAPSDAVASSQPERTKWALEIMRESMGAQTRAVGDLSLTAWGGC